MFKRSFTALVQRHAIQWRRAEFYDQTEVEEEMRRVMDVCHGCRRCVSLCNAFPVLFDQLEELEVEELPSSAFKAVVDECTLCDMCYAHSCPYVPPHEWDIDLPHLILRYRALEQQKDNEEAMKRLEVAPPAPYKQTAKHMKQFVEDGVSRKLELGPPSYVHRLIADQNLIGRVGVTISKVVNAATAKGSALRPLMESVANIHKEAPLPQFESQTWFSKFVHQPIPEPKKKAVLFASCSVNHSNHGIGDAALTVLRKLGVDVEVASPGCCGMPQLEQGLVADVSKRALEISPPLLDFVDRGFDIVSLTPSCTLMIKQEWPLLLDEDDSLKRLANSTFELSQYIYDLLKSNDTNVNSVDASVTLHHACHARAQNSGFSALKMLKAVPGLEVTSIERCSGHGGTWGVLKEHHETAKKFGAPVVSRIKEDVSKSKKSVHYIASECPLAATHLSEQIDVGSTTKCHPVEILAKALT